MVRASAVCIIISIAILSAAMRSGAQTGDSNQYGEGSGVVTLEMYRQRQIDTQLEMERQQIEIQRQQLQMQRQQIEMQRQQLENQRQQLENQRQQLEMDREKLRIEREKKQTD